MKFLSLLLFCNLMYSQINIEKLRIDFEKSITDEKICLENLNKLENTTSKNEVYLAYFGAFQTIYANHVFNPINKLTYFNKGKKNIEKAIKLNPNNIDIRFLRYSIQKKCPKFLGYKNNIEEDTNFLNSNIEKATSSQLKKMINDILNN